MQLVGLWGWFFQKASLLEIFATLQGCGSGNTDQFMHKKFFFKLYISNLKYQALLLNYDFNIAQSVSVY